MSKICAKHKLALDFLPGCPDCLSERLKDAIEAANREPADVVMGPPARRTRCARCSGFEVENGKLRRLLSEERFRSLALLKSARRFTDVACTCHQEDVAEWPCRACELRDLIGEAETLAGKGKP